MTHKLAARVGAQSAVVGTAAVTFGAALAAHKAFGAVLATGDTTEYLLYACDANGAATGAWEVGVGTYYGPGDAGGERLERTTVHENSAGTAVPIEFAAGDKRVVITPLSARLNAVPSGGAAGQILTVQANGSYAWADAPAGGGGGGGATYLPIPDGHWRLSLFVRADGNDANTGLEDTPGGALLTLKAALDKAYSYEHTADTRAEINIGTGTYELPDYLPPAGDSRPFTISLQANTEAQVVITALVLASIREQNLELYDFQADRAYVLNAKLQNIGHGAAGGNYYLPSLEVAKGGVVEASYSKIAGYASERFNLQRGAKLTLVSPEFLAGSTNGTIFKADSYCELMLSIDYTGDTTGKKYDLGAFCVFYTPDFSGTGSSLPGATAGVMGVGSVLS